MQVLVLNTSECGGGAAVAARRLTDALNLHGAEALMAVRDKQSSSPHTLAIPQALRLRGAFLWERLRILASNRLRREGLWAVDIACSGADVTCLPEFRRADIVHLHWVNQGLLSLGQLGRILDSGKPVVWTLHDMWPCTAICHHAGSCPRYERHCHDCPQLAAPGRHDLSWQVFRRKAATYGRGRLTFVAVSRWMAARAAASALTGGHAVEVIPNALPAGQFRPMDKRQARRQTGIGEAERVVAFGAARIDAPGKGFLRLTEALERLAGEAPGLPLRLLLFGRMKDKTLLRRVPCPCTYAGEVADADGLRRIYAASDVLVNASDYETFGQTLAEAMACGCPPVSFDRGGQTDIIRHLQDGYLARHGSTADLAAGIRWAMQSPPDPQVLHQSAASRFGEEAVARRHIALYERLMLT